MSLAKDRFIDVYDETVHRAASSTETTLSTTLAEIVSHDVTGVEAGDVIIARVFGALRNNSGSARTYTFTPDFDDAFASSASFSLNTNANQRSFRFEWVLAVISTSVARYRGTIERAGSASAVGNWSSDQNTYIAWDESTSDLTGTVTVSLDITSGLIPPPRTSLRTLLKCAISEQVADG